MQADPKAGAQPLVLVIDADESVRRLLRIKLAGAGFRVMTATDGEQGLAQAQAHDPALVLLDGTLSKLDAYRLTGELARLSGDKRPAIVFLSAVEDPSDVERALRSGCDDYVVKPFSPEELIHRLKLALLRRQLAAEGRVPNSPGRN